ncbi:MAG: putative acetyl transferase [Glaciihabitans sp.]|nr:putative acetyl transferase [Glaciihabitans sp.]
MTATVAAAIEAPRQPDVLDLLQQSDEFTLALYPPESCHLLDVAELEANDVEVFVARRDGVAIGTAALVERADGTAELKRMFVTAAARGLGAGSILLRSVEDRATARGIRLLQLETGPKQLAAITLYERSGYRLIPNFGEYVNDPFSVCYEKTLA